MIAANMNTTPTLVFNFENPKFKIRKKVKIMCENYCRPCCPNRPTALSHRVYPCVGFSTEGRKTSRQRNMRGFRRMSARCSS